MIRSLVVAALLAAVLPGPVAHADDRSLANEALREGNALRDAGRCREALARFEQARRLFPAAEHKIGVNLAGALECLGRYREAIAQLQRFLERSGEETEAAAIEAVRRRARTLEGRLARLTVRCPVPCARLAIDGAELGQAPPPSALLLDPGPHEVVARRERREPLRRQVELKPGETRLLLLEWPAEPPPRLVRARPFYTRWWFWTAVGAALVGAGVGIGVSRSHSGSQRLPGGELGEVVLKP